MLAVEQPDSGSPASRKIAYEFVPMFVNERLSGTSLGGGKANCDPGHGRDAAGAGDGPARPSGFPATRRRSLWADG